MNPPSKGTDIPIGTRVKVNSENNTRHLYYGIVKGHILPQDDSILIEKIRGYYGSKLNTVEIKYIEIIDPKLEEDFKNTYNSVSAEINSKLEMINTILNDVINLSETHGIPFASNVSQIHQPYVPRTFKNKFGELPPEIVYELTGAYFESSDYGGWQHSAIC